MNRRLWMHRVNAWVEELGHQRRMLRKRGNESSESMILDRNVFIRIGFINESPAIVRIERSRQIVILKERDDNHFAILGVDRTEFRICSIFVSSRNVRCSPFQILLVNRGSNYHPRLEGFFSHPDTLIRLSKHQCRISFLNGQNSCLYPECAFGLVA